MRLCVVVIVSFYDLVRLWIGAATTRCGCDSVLGAAGCGCDSVRMWLGAAATGCGCDSVRLRLVRLRQGAAVIWCGCDCVRLWLGAAVLVIDTLLSCSCCRFGAPIISMRIFMDSSSSSTSYVWNQKWNQKTTKLKRENSWSICQYFNEFVMG